MSGWPSGSVCAGFLVETLKPAVSLAPAVGLSEHSSAGTFSWTNANAGATDAPTKSSDTTKVRSILRVALTFSHLPSLKERGDQPRLKLINATTLARMRYYTHPPIGLALANFGEFLFHALR